MLSYKVLSEKTVHVISSPNTRNFPTPTQRCWYSKLKLDVLLALQIKHCCATVLSQLSFLCFVLSFLKWSWAKTLQAFWRFSHFHIFFFGHCLLFSFIFSESHWIQIYLFFVQLIISIAQWVPAAICTTQLSLCHSLGRHFRQCCWGSCQNV